MALERRYGARGHDFDGVFFAEDPVAGGESLGIVAAASNRQNTNIDSLKRSMASQARSRGGNVIANFTYAQKGTVFSWSNTRWEASGQVLRMPPETAANPAAVSPSATKRCPMCAEEILAEARKCKHCGEMLAE